MVFGPFPLSDTKRSDLISFLCRRRHSPSSRVSKNSTIANTCFPRTPRRRTHAQARARLSWIRAVLASIKTQAKRGAGIEPIPNWALHDLRRTAKTLMARAGVRPDISERVLGHVIAGVEGTYDRHSYADEKRDALGKLSAMIERILNPLPPNVATVVRHHASASL